jgi:hypothetical protein
VYGFFTDLSEMGWKVKHNPFNNITTHSMNKIVQAFAPSMGKEKDDKGELIILEVVDLPVSAWLKYGPQLNDFFKWAEHHNDYHPEALDTVFIEVPKSYHPLRYPTKSYDKCTNSLSIFY